MSDHTDATDSAPQQDPATEQPSAAHDAQPTPLASESAASDETASADTEALAWLAAPATAAAATPATTESLLAQMPLRRRGRVWIPIVALGALAATYVVAAAVWPLDELRPSVTTLELEAPAGGDVSMTWPLDGLSGVGIGGTDPKVSSTEAFPMASITKVVTVLTLLDHTGLEPGDDGRTFDFTQADSDAYWQYRWANESALDVPVDGSLTEYQMLEGIMLGSASNYADTLVEATWDTNEEFVAAAADWLERNELTDITVVEPTGIDYGNTATPESLIRLAQIAMQNPVVAEIAAKPSVDLPGAGKVESTNRLINDDGVVGLKTGSLEGYNLLSVKNLDIDGTTVQAYGVVMGQPSEDDRDIASRALYDQIAEQLVSTTVVPAGTEVGTVTMPWGAETGVVTATDARLVLMEETPGITSDLQPGDADTEGTAVGTVTVSSSLGTQSVDATLVGDLPGPSLSWRLTHPLALLGLGD